MSKLLTARGVWEGDSPEKQKLKNNYVVIALSRDHVAVVIRWLAEQSKNTHIVWKVYKKRMTVFIQFWVCINNFEI